ncbi:Tom7 [Carpediemonas membranifera]|uniref:Tom7 n=1 Tax=Carpediemonas membranifera TaxID=201153 RepID=A0A8J6B6A7_9EUKA|nr:Tom7 [Carpediemonas membranifera]|eukprot:KAG9393737.1 Tom7 [Carpediemonas membranifera]
MNGIRFHAQQPQQPPSEFVRKVKLVQRKFESIARPAVQYGAIPLILYLGLTTDPRPNMLSVFNPL